MPRRNNQQKTVEIKKANLDGFFFSGKEGRRQFEIERPRTKEVMKPNA